MLPAQRGRVSTHPFGLLEQGGGVEPCVRAALRVAGDYLLWTQCHAIFPDGHPLAQDRCP